MAALAGHTNVRAPGGDGNGTVSCPLAGSASRTYIDSILSDELTEASPTPVGQDEIAWSAGLKADTPGESPRDGDPVYHVSAQAYAVLNGTYVNPPAGDSTDADATERYESGTGGLVGR